MTSFLFIENYSPISNLLIGTASFFGFYGIGLAIMMAARVALPSPWAAISAILLGIEAQSLTVQVIGYGGGLSTSALKILWVAQALIGAAFLFRQIPALRSAKLPTIPFFGRAALAIVFVASLANLLVAIAPSTKIDELFYHMLVPSRIAVDQALHFYPWPWQAAILPQMIYQIASAPAHAIGHPDAANVVSWWTSLALSWFAWRSIRGEGQSPNWSALWVASICVGMYPVVWLVTSGAHAMGDLAIVAAIVAIAERDRSLRSVAPSTYGAMVSLFALAAASSKVTLLPLSGAIVLFSAWLLLRTGGARQRIGALLAITLPWLIFYLPILIWTWTQSGSPFGPMLAGVFGPSTYSASWMQSELKGGLEKLPLSEAAWLTLLGYSPLVWIGAAGVLLVADLPRTIRVFLVSVTCLELLLLFFLLPNDVRYLGGLHFALLVVFASRAQPATIRLASSRLYLVLAALVLVLPWLAVQCYYARQFAAVSLGFEKTAFYERYVPFYADFTKLNDILPKDAILLVDYRLGTVYSPRPVIFNLFEMPRNKPTFFFGAPETIARMRLAKEISESAPVVYENRSAVIETFRTPGRVSTRGPIQVVEVLNR